MSREFYLSFHTISGFEHYLDMVDKAVAMVHSDLCRYQRAVEATDNDPERQAVPYTEADALFVAECLCHMTAEKMMLSADLVWLWYQNQGVPLVDCCPECGHTHAYPIAGMAQYGDCAECGHPVDIHTQFT